MFKEKRKPFCISKEILWSITELTSYIKNVIKMKKWHSVQPSMALGRWTRKNFYSDFSDQFSDQ